MKKIFSLMFALLAVNLAWADDEAVSYEHLEDEGGSGFWFNVILDEKGSPTENAEITWEGENEPTYSNGNYKDFTGEVTTPSYVYATFDGEEKMFTVTGIGKDALSYCVMTSLIISEGVTSLGANALYYSRSLEYVKIPSTINEWGSTGFYNCWNLSVVEFADDFSYKSIPESSFGACHSLKSIKIPSSVNSIGSCAFMSVGYSLDEGEYFEIELPEGVETLESNALWGTKLRTIEIPSSVKSLGSWAFRDCKNLIGVYCKGATPPSLSGSQYVFSTYDKDDDGNYVYNNGLEGCELYVPEEAVDTYKDSDWGKTYFSEIKSYTFKDGNGICYEKIIDEEDHVKVVANSEGYSGEITIPETVTTAEGDTYTVTQIGYEAFLSCTGLTEITIPASVKTIETGAFNRCYSLATITFADGSQLEEIGDYAFQMCPTTSMVLPESCTKIGYGAFYQNSFTEFEFPEGVEEINFGMFAGCDGLTTVTIPSSVTAIDKWVFVNCTALKTIYCNSTAIPTLGEDVFVTGTYDYSQADKLTEATGKLTDITMYVPDGLKYLYKDDDAWVSKFTAYENMIDGNALTDDFGNSYYYYNVDAEVVLTLTAVGVSDEGVAEIPTNYENEDFIISVDAFAEAEFTELIIPWTTPENAIDPSAYFTDNTASLLTVPEGSEWVYYFSDWSTYFTINAELSFTTNDEYGTYTYAVDQTSGTVVLTDFTGGDYIIIESTISSTVDYENTTFTISSVTDDALSNIVLWVPRGTLDDYSSIEENGIFKEICETPDLYIDGIYYNFIYSDDGVEELSLKARTISLEVTNGPEAYEGDITIPETVSVRSVDLGEDADVTYEVTSLSSTAFKDCTDLTSVTLESSVPLENADALNQVPESCVIVVEDEATRTAYSAILTSVTVYTEEEYKAIVSGITIKVIDKIELERYNLLGQRVNAPVRGINIVKYSDGTVEKVLVK